MPLTWDSSPSSMHAMERFGLHLLTQRSFVFFSSATSYSLLEWSNSLTLLALSSSPNVLACIWSFPLVTLLINFLSFFKIYFVKFYVCRYFACMYVCALHVRPKKNVRNLVLELQTVGRLHLSTGDPSDEQPVLLTAKNFLQFILLHFLFNFWVFHSIFISFWVLFSSCYISFFEFSFQFLNCLCHLIQPYYLCFLGIYCYFISPMSCLLMPSLSFLKSVRKFMIVPLNFVLWSSLMKFSLEKISIELLYLKKNTVFAFHVFCHVAGEQGLLSLFVYLISDSRLHLLNINFILFVLLIKIGWF